MRYQLSSKARTQYEALAAHERRALQKQVDYLVANLRHPSLHANKYDEATGLWQARVNRSWRFYFLIHTDVYYVVGIRTHPK